MILIRILFLAILIAPFIFVMGTITSQAELLGPFPVGVYEAGISGFTQRAEMLKAKTGGLVKNEISFLIRLIEGSGFCGISEKVEELERLKRCTGKSV